MSSKKFVKITIATTAVLLLAVVITVFIFDPLFQYHKPFFDLYPTDLSGGYVIPGVAKSFDYDCAIIGSSLSMNFDASQFEEAFGCDCAKLTVYGLEPKEADGLLNSISANSAKPQAIFFEVRPRVFLIDNYDDADDIPSYLVDNNYFNDSKYIFNSTIWGRFLLNMEKSSKKEFLGKLNFDTMWKDDVPGGSKETALSNYDRPEMSEPVHSLEEYAKYADKNMSGLLNHVEENPDIEYYIYFPPVSVLYWDTVIRGGNLKIIKDGMMKTVEKLLQYSNVNVFVYSNDKSLSTIKNLDHYIDSIHYDPEVSEYMLDCFISGENKLNIDNYASTLENFFSEIENYDYESVFE